MEEPRVLLYDKFDHILRFPFRNGEANLHGGCLHIWKVQAMVEDRSRLVAPEIAVGADVESLVRDFAESTVIVDLFALHDAGAAVVLVKSIPVDDVDWDIVAEMVVTKPLVDHIVA